VRRLIGIASALAGLFVALWLAAVELGWLDERNIARWLESLASSEAGRASFAAAVVGLLAADLMLPIPSSVVALASGAVLGTWWGGLASTLGILLGALLGYVLCRVGGARWFRRLVPAEDAAAAQRWFDRYGPLAIVLGRPVPVLPEVLACIAGLARMSPGLYLASSLAGALPFAFAMSWWGEHTGAEEPGRFLVFAIGIAMLAWAAWLALRRPPTP
jgi:uncharacterized membrane protein YdjX (TVP38/TMEM64 family)